YGKERFDHHKVHVHESPWSMLGPLCALAVLSIFGGWFALPSFWGGKDYFAAFLAPVFGGGEAAAAGAEAAATEAAAHSLELTLAVAAVVTATIGFFIAYWLYSKNPKKPAELAKSLNGVYNILLHKYYVDELYAAVVVKPLMWVSREVLWQRVDVQ